MDLAGMDLGIRRTCEGSRGRAALVETSLASLHGRDRGARVGVERRAPLRL